MGFEELAEKLKDIDKIEELTVKLKDVDHLVNKSLKEQINDVQRKLKEKHIQNIFSNESYELL